MNKDQLKKFVEENPRLVSMRPAGTGISVLKYKKTVFYNNLWNDFLEECRGTIVDADFNVVSRPFTKIYNYGVEAKAPVLSGHTPLTAYRKVNGFMIAMSWHNNDILVSTTGSTDSPFVDLAKEMMLTHMSWADWQMALLGGQGFTYMFECVHPTDPHIVPEKPGMYFLGWRANTWESTVVGYGSDIGAVWTEYAQDVLHCYSTETMNVTVNELIALSKTVKHEGFVAYTEDGQSFKIKSPYYLTSKWVARNPRTDKLTDLTRDIKHNIDEEYYNLIDAIRLNIVEYTAMTEQSRLSWVRGQLEAV